MIRVDRGICTLLGADGTRRASIGGALLAAAAHDPTRLPCAGDWTVLRTWPDERLTIEAVLPRRTAIVRASAGAEALGQILVANVDTVAVVVPVDPEPDLGLVERLLSLAWESGARPVVALTKVDLAAHPEILVEEVGEIAPGVEVFGVSAATGVGLDQLRALAAAGRTLGLLGASGSGKSTLVNALAGATVMPTQPIRRADGRGRHTTTHRALIPLPGGGAVIDIPGIRAAGPVRRNRRTRSHLRRHRRARGPVPVRRLYARTRARLCGASRPRRWGAEPRAGWSTGANSSARSSANAAGTTFGSRRTSGGDGLVGRRARTRARPRSASDRR